MFNPHILKKLIVHSFILVLLFIQSAIALAQDTSQQIPENGLWKGTIGDIPILVCFSYDPTVANRSAYFYLKYKRPIALTPPTPQRTMWAEGLEDQPNALWDMHINGDAITGDWVDQKTNKKLPLNLSYMRAFNPGGSSCDFIFDEEEITPYAKMLREKIIEAPIQSIGNQQYRPLFAIGDAISSVELLGDPSLTPLNNQLKNTFYLSIANYYQCGLQLKQSEVFKNEPIDFYSSVTPVYWDKNWITFVSHVSGFCGGAYPFRGQYYTTINLKTLQQVNLWHWFKDSRKEDASPQFDDSYINYVAPRSLNQMILQEANKAYPSETAEHDDGVDTCMDALKNNEQYEIHFGSKGLIFSTSFPHVIQACDVEVEISYQQIMPFLTPEGKKAIKQIMARQK